MSSTDNHAAFKLTSITFLACPDAQFDARHLTTSKCVYVLSCCHVIGLLDICFNEQLNRCA